MDKETKLLHIAEEQQGYFTSQQAQECGFSRPNFHKKIASGRWQKEKVRGVYRLSNYPPTARPELVLWTLWSKDKKGHPQGVWSHETALDIHGLSEVSPAKLHMSVPKIFRKSAKIPNNICLHYVENIPYAEIEMRQGYYVTKPIRTLTDIIRTGTTQIEQIQRAIFDLAIQKSLLKGLATIQEIEQLIHCTDSEDLRKIIACAIDEVWLQANNRIMDFGLSIEPYTIGLVLGDKGFGTAVLCQYKSHFFLLTAAHVGRTIQKAKSVQMILKFDHHTRRYPEHSGKSFEVIEWDPTFTEDMLENVLANHPKDLCVILLQKDIINTLSIYKSFYQLSEVGSGFSLQDAFVSMGGIEASYSKEHKTYELCVGPFGYLASSYNQFPEVDYLVCPVSSHTYDTRNLRRKIVSSFAGLSGSGLWKFINNSPVLVGIAIAEDSLECQEPDTPRNVYFHGPQSIVSALATLEQSYDSQ